MGFWGIEVKPGKPHPYHSDNVEGTLNVTQATLGLGSSTERCILQCSVGHKNPIFLCSLLPDRNESCSLNLEFKDELVAFSVIGPRSIHLSGYFFSNEGDDLPHDYVTDSGEDILISDTEDSSEFDYDGEYDDFIDDDEMLCPSPVPNSGVVIEEIVDDDKTANGNCQSKRSKKKNSHSSEHKEQNNSQQQIVIKKGTGGGSFFDSEDEDGFPITSSQKSKAEVEESKAEDNVEKEMRTKETKKKKGADSDDATVKKRKIKSTEDGQQIRKKKKGKLKEKSDKVNTDGLIGDDKNNNLSSIQQEEVKKVESHDLNEHEQRGLVTNASSEPGKSTSDKKKKRKKKKKNQDDGEDTSKNKTVSTMADEGKSSVGSEDKPSATKTSQVRTFSNGLVIEEMAMGRPDGKKASPGSQVSVQYIGKLKKNGQIFDSNVGGAPFKFRLGVGQVIKGWDVGVNGMRIGDKRRLTIPPAMGYGDKGAGGKIPPNSWLVFDVELVNVK